MVLEEGEECDDGNRVSGDSCSAVCLLELGYCGDGIVQRELGEQCDGPLSVLGLPYSCGPDCRILSPLCGDGKLDPGEECDDGDANTDERDGACRTNCSRMRCGDGIVDMGEECDDGNLYTGDGCDRLCRREIAPPPTLAQVINIPGQPAIPPSQVAPPSPTRPPEAPTGPAALAVMAAGGAAGLAWIRRRRKA
jgi:cysteine-rich repeat protein